MTTIKFESHIYLPGYYIVDSHSISGQYSNYIKFNYFIFIYIFKFNYNIHFMYTYCIHYMFKYFMVYYVYFKF